MVYGRPVISTDHTTWTYNTDDTIQSVKDARGASATYIYANGRHLVNEIHYSAPSGIIPTSNVTFGYDHAGNRTSMTDGLGSKSYSYNSLSQLMSETRTFNDPNNSAINGVAKTLSYNYNLAGELIQLVDQATGRSLSYGHDAVGRLTVVSGSGFGAVSSFADNFAYRASGAAKHFNYGNGTSMNLSYNSRGLPTQYSLSGVKEPNGTPRAEGSDFQYYADGRLKFATDYYERSFSSMSHHDRAYEYDQMGRLKKGMSSVDANDFINGTQSGNHAGPFQQNYNLDVWSNLTSRSGSYWGEDDAIGTQNYDARNRNTAWSYDAAGNLLSMNEPAPDELTFVPAQHSYDAGGQHVQVTQTTSTPSPFNPNLIWTIATTTRDEYDGDGLQVKQVRSKQTNGGQPQSVITYYLRSSALGGNIVSEYDGQGAEQLFRVFAEGDQIASVASGGVEWRYANPVTGDVRESDAQGKIGATTHLDPEGVNVGATDPGSNQGEPSPPEPLPQAGAYASLLPRSAGGMRTCKLEGFAIGCGWIKSLEDTGHVAPVNQIQFIQRRWVKPSSVGLKLPKPPNPFDKFLPTETPEGTPIERTNSLEPQGHWETEIWTTSFPAIPQNPSPTPPAQPLPPNYRPPKPLEQPCIDRTNDVRRDISAIAKTLHGKAGALQQPNKPFPGAQIDPGGQSFGKVVNTLYKNGYSENYSLDHSEGWGFQKKFNDGLWYHVIVEFPKGTDTDLFGNLQLNQRAPTPQITAHCHATNPNGAAHIIDRIFGP